MLHLISGYSDSGTAWHNCASQLRQGDAAVFIGKAVNLLQLEFVKKYIDKYNAADDLEFYILAEELSHRDERDQIDPTVIRIISTEVFIELIDRHDRCVSWY